MVVDRVVAANIDSRPSSQLGILLYDESLIRVTIPSVVEPPEWS